MINLLLLYRDLFQIAFGQLDILRGGKGQTQLRIAEETFSSSLREWSLDSTAVLRSGSGSLIFNLVFSPKQI